MFALKLSLKTSQLLRPPPHVFLFQLLSIFLKLSFQKIKSELKGSSACSMNVFFFKKIKILTDILGVCLSFLTETI